MFVHMCNALCCAGIQIAALAGAERRRPILGVVYDELFRQYAEDLSSKLGSSFDVEKHFSAQSDEILRRAIVVHDQMYRGQGTKGPQSAPAPPPVAVPVRIVCIMLVMRACLPDC